VKLSLGSPLSRKKKLLVVLLIAATWTLSILGPLSLGVIPILLCAPLLSVRWKNVMPLSVVIASPVAVAFVIGVYKWTIDHPAFVGTGLPSPAAFNLDRTSRMWWDTGGCVVTGNEWVFVTPHNLGLRLTSILLGPPRRTYRGVYPSAEETRRLTDKAAITPSQKFFDGILIVEDREIDIGKDHTQLIRQDIGQDWWDPEGVVGKGKVTVVLVNSECLIVRVVSDGGYFDGKNHSDGAMLIDFKTMLPFARYSFIGTLPRIPRYALPNNGGYGVAKRHTN
jgi:hypothetical protein